MGPGALGLLLAAALPAQEQEKELRRLFDALDRDGDGRVGSEEFPGSDAQLAAMDRDRDGKASFEEYRGSAVARMLLAARNRMAMPPRERIDADALTRRRLRAVSRFDANGDGRVTAQEWNGVPAAFDALDLQRDGVLDGADRRLAAARGDDGERRLAAVVAAAKARLPDPEEIFRRHDRDREELLTRAEARAARLGELFDAADRNRDELLDRYEVTAIARLIAARVAARNRGEARPRAQRVPFSTWDADDDGRIDSGEWRGPQALFARCDLDRDGAVTRLEVERYERAVEGRSFVEKFDLDADGSVTPAEFGGPPQAFRRADRNGDGIVSRADR